jgi:formylglycine-generating enzyme required for sulfatase activity
VAGATASTLSINNAQTADAGDYRVVVNNSAGTVTSSVAKLTVNLKPVGPTGFVCIAPGTFVMGSPVSEPLRYTDETQHQVQLTRDFLICDHEVTQAEYKSLVGNNPSGFRGDDLPVESVTWAEAVAYCEKLTLRERAVGRITQKQIFRLPTEAEWEYACRVGTTGQFSGNLRTVAWYEGNSESRVHSVKSKPANGFGLHDMHGNVSEWCADWYGSYSTKGVKDPTGPAVGTEWPPYYLGFVGGGRVVRGGNYQFLFQECRSATRMAATPDDRYDGRGFRVVLASIP